MKMDAVSFLPEDMDNDAFLRAVYAVLDTTLHRFPAKVALYMAAEQAEAEVLPLCVATHLA
jgi:hypothetical protein